MSCPFSPHALKFLLLFFTSMKRPLPCPLRPGALPAGQEGSARGTCFIFLERQQASTVALSDWARLEPNLVPRLSPFASFWICDEDVRCRDTRRPVYNAFLER